MQDKKNVNAANSKAANSGNSDKSQVNVGQILAQSQKDKSGGSAYGLTVDLICSDLSLLSDKARLVKKLEEHGIDAKASKNAVQTGLSQTRNVVSKLHQNGFLA